jgi:hypothetical protein
LQDYTSEYRGILLTHTLNKNNMRNAKQELLDTIGSNIANLRCATITHSPFDWSEEVPSKKIVLKEGYSQADLDEFISKLDFEYDGGYGSQELFGMVWFNDGYWMDRYEYDGSERWDWHKYPTIPDELKETSFPDPKDIDYPDDYDEMMNQMINQEYDENNEPEYE